MAKKTYPDVIYVKLEGDARNKEDQYLAVHESFPADGPDWEGFAVYKRVGTGRARNVVEKQVALDSPKKGRA